MSQNEFSAILKNRLSMSFGSKIFSITFAGLELVSVDNTSGIVDFSAPSQAVKDKILLVHQDKFKRIVSTTCSEILLVSVRQINISVRAAGLNAAGNATSTSCIQRPKVEDFRLRFTPLSMVPDASRYDFENFITSSENNVAYSTCKEFSSIVQQNQNQSMGQNILFINGSVGNGKTHLMNSMALQIAKNTGKRITYLTADKFMFQYIKSIRENTLFDFKEKLQNTDVLFVDDIHFICGKKSSSEELLNAINLALTEGKFVICSSVYQPAVIASKYEDETTKKIASVLNAGLSCRISNPSAELRRKIIQAKANAAGLVLNQSVIEYLVLNTASNVRDIESVIVKLSFNAKFIKKNIDIAFAQGIVSEILAVSTKQITSQDVINATAVTFGLEPDDIIKDNPASQSGKDVSVVRQIAICLTKELTSLSYAEIALAFGKKTTSCVTASITAMDRLKKDPQTFIKISRIVSLLKDPGYFN